MEGDTTGARTGLKTELTGEGRKPWQTSPNCEHEVQDAPRGPGERGACSGNKYCLYRFLLAYVTCLPFHQKSQDKQDFRMLELSAGEFKITLINMLSAVGKMDKCEQVGNSSRGGSSYGKFWS